uniref:NADH-ubiquinone oxidoreductase chain 2 n=1 Tax=Pristimantis pirrensis TaxID=448825 RepID=B3FVX3_9NEOB|nr:NADH dehydrogenase subunit II [Pristimantis pirrensis]
MNPYTLSCLVSGLAIGTIMTLSSLHWILIWIGLEINTLAIIPLMVKIPHPRAIEAATKYFLTQATASALLLFSSTINAWIIGEWIIASSLEVPTILLTSAISIKLGIAPFHLWLPEVLQGLTIKTGLILSTWQKLAPMSVFIQLSTFTNLYLIIILGTISMAIGGWNGINQTQTRKILAFSSIAHLGWMTIILNFNPQLTLLNFLFYILMTSTLFMMFSLMNTKNLPELATSWPKSPPTCAMSMLTLLSLSGLPPLTGFTPKWLIAQEMVKQNLTMLTLIILLSSLLTLFFYLRLTYIISLTLTPNLSFSPTWTLYKMNTLAPLITLSLFLLPMTPMIWSNT